ncbi:MAG: ADP-ribose pyrophosphatase [Planctomycetaceae bacterium]|nr:ADP-ribose pyrophosphatase [Planctomycetaceae bacterium]
MTHISKAVPIGIALVENDGQFLVGLRPDGVALAGYSEFPGGKCLDNETPAECAIRECHEETGLVVVTIEELDRTTFEYEHATVDLSFWLCHLTGQLSRVEPPWEWLSLESLKTRKFPDANAGILEKLLLCEARKSQ